MTSKKCSRCKNERLLEEFNKDSRTPDNLSYRCTFCDADYRKTVTPSTRRKHKLKTKYDMTPAEYNAIHKAQNGKCGVCFQKETVVNVQSGKVQKLSVDHNHTTGKIRGLLCTACNKALGLLKDDPALLLSGATYLIRTDYDKRVPDPEPDKPDPES